MTTEKPRDGNPPPREAAISQDDRQELEIEKIGQEIGQLKYEATQRGWEKTTRLLSSSGPAVTALTVIVALIGYYLQGTQFQRNLDQQREQFTRNLEIQGTQFKKNLDHQMDQIKAQFNTTNDLRYLEKGWALCEAIIDAAGQMRLRTTPSAQARFDQLLYGRSAALRDFGDSELRLTMSEYRDKPANCRGSEVCLSALQPCVEAMACECQALLCKSAPTFPGCMKDGTPLNCSMLNNLCKKNRKGGAP